MNPRVAGKVRRDGGGADVFAAGKSGHGGVIQAEAAVVIGKIQDTSRGQPCYGHLQ